jgi:hypothetical protein
MNKIIIVGHPFSGYQDVEALLNSSGVAAAQPSYHERITPGDIGSTLRKAHGLASVDQLTSGDQIRQVSVGSVWNGMALDLLRGNLEQPLWGWSDPQAIYFLDYWKQLDPTLIFVLVYNHPRTVLSQDPSGAQDLTSEALEQRIHQWQIYNEALLHFHHRNKDRSLLVHGQQVGISAKKYVQQVRARISNNQSTNAELLLTDPNFDPVAQEMAPSQVQISDKSTEDQHWLQTLTSTQENPLKQFLAGELIELYPKAVQLYEELQAVASLPAGDVGTVEINSLAAWRAMSDLYRQSQVLDRQTYEKQQYIALLEGKQEELAKQNRESVEENKLLLAQLHQVQEELEINFIEGRQKIQELEGVQKASSEQQQKIKELQLQLKNLNEQVEKKEQQLQQSKELLQKNSKELQAQLNTLNEQLKDKKNQLDLVQKQSQEDSKGLKEENELLLAQLHQVQEELERYFLENRELKAHQQPVYFGAAERLKSGLSYRLGAAIIERSRKVWPLPFLPFSLWVLARRHRKEQPESAQNLPSLEEYRDYHEAQKAQKQLSFRLGTAWLKHIRRPWGWMFMPFALIGAHHSYRQYRKELSK